MWNFSKILHRVLSRIYVLSTVKFLCLKLRLYKKRQISGMGRKCLIPDLASEAGQMSWELLAFGCSEQKYFLHWFYALEFNRWEIILCLCLYFVSEICIIYEDSRIGNQPESVRTGNCWQSRLQSWLRWFRGLVVLELLIWTEIADQKALVRVNSQLKDHKNKTNLR